MVLVRNAEEYLKDAAKDPVPNIHITFGDGESGWAHSVLEAIADLAVEHEDPEMAEAVRGFIRRTFTVEVVCPMTASVH